MVKGRTRPALDGKNTLTQDGGRLTEIQGSISTRQAPSIGNLSLVLRNWDGGRGEHGRQCGRGEFAGNDTEAGAERRPALAGLDHGPRRSMDRSRIEFTHHLLHRDAGLSQTECEGAFNGRGSAQLR